MSETPAPYGEAPKSDFESQFRRIMAAAACATPAQLAEFLGVNRAAVHGVKRRRRIPPEWLLKILAETGINPAWVRTGRPPRQLRPSDVFGPVPTPTDGFLAGWSTDELCAEILGRAFRATGRRAG